MDECMMINYLLKYFQNQYFDRYPKGLNPVQINDIFFSLHAVFATTVTISQCFIYEVIDRDMYDFRRVTYRN